MCGPLPKPCFMWGLLYILGANSISFYVEFSYCNFLRENDYRCVSGINHVLKLIAVSQKLICSTLCQFCYWSNLTMNVSIQGFSPLRPLFLITWSLSLIIPYFNRERGDLKLFCLYYYPHFFPSSRAYCEFCGVLFFSPSETSFP